MFDRDPANRGDEVGGWRNRYTKRDDGPMP
jgi:hypothetical protein